MRETLMCGAANVILLLFPRSRRALRLAFWLKANAPGAWTK